MHANSKKKYAKTSARVRDERFRLALNAISDGVWDWDRSSGQVYRSPQYYKLVGRSPEEDAGDFEFIKRTVFPGDLPRVLEAIEAHQQGRLPSIDISYRVNDISGELRWLRLRGRVIDRDADRTPLRILGTVSDITEIKLMEASLRESEALLGELQEIANIGTYVLDIPAGALVKFSGARSYFWH